MEINKEHIINYYNYGWELSSSDAPFPDWFEFGYEKVACLMGYNAFDTGLQRSDNEIVEEVLKLIK